MELSKNDKSFLKYVRSIAIFIIVFGHVGGFWFYKPYSSFLLTMVPVFFFLSGSVAFFSYERYQNAFGYLGKRIIGLLTPYYFACFLLLTFFYIKGLEFPVGTLNIINWLTVTPTAEEMPFLFSYVWFLRVLVMITIISPFLFEVHKRNNKNIPILILFGLILSASQCIINTGRVMAILDDRFYIFLIESMFFVFGFYYYTNKNKITDKILVGFLLLSVLSCFVLVKIFHVEVSLDAHEYYPDLYYVSASFVTITFLLLIKNALLFFQKLSVVRAIFNFLHKHTFSIFLLHGFGLYVADNLFGYILPTLYKQHDVKYGLIMLFFTMLTTCLASIIFTKFVSKCQTYLISQFQSITN